MKRILAYLIAAMLPLSVSAQTLRVTGNGSTRDYAAATGVRGSAYPADAVAQIGGSVRADNAGALVRVFGDSIRFWTGSPFFRAGATIFHLAHAPVANNGELQIPEQFFIQWLPVRYASRLEYREGALRMKDERVAAPVTPASTPRTAPATPIPGAKRIVVIDPGHGGTDPGASGPNGLKEGQAVLMIATRLSSLLRTRGYEVHMTRTRDTLISLADRPRMANRWKGDNAGTLYISIHANSGVSQARGFETYFLSEASTDDERRVAEMENSAVRFEKRAGPTASELDQVLNGLRNDFYLRASNDFATVVQQNMAQFHSGPNRGVKRAPFRVLVGALMPAVLVEVGFISNPREADLLGTAAFQDKLAFGLAQSVDAFFRDNEALWQ